MYIIWNFLLLTLLFHLLRIPFPLINTFDVIALMYGVRLLYSLARSMLAKSLHDKPCKGLKIYFCRTYHSRFTPVRHAFDYPHTVFGVDLDELERRRGWRKWLFGYNTKFSLFSIHDKDYLGDISQPSNSSPLKTIKQKLLWHLSNHNIPTSLIARVELVTMPRLLNYAFNPVSFHYCYDKDDVLRVIVLEVNNTFGEKYLYVLGRENNNQRTVREGYDMCFTIKRAFHVSPFNDRKGYYTAYCKDPSDGMLSLCLVMYESDSPFLTPSTSLSTASAPGPYFKKFVATISGTASSLSLQSMAYMLLSYPVDIFLTMPRIMKEAYTLHYRKKMKVFHRPKPMEGTVVTLKPNFIERYAQEVVVKYLTFLVTLCKEPTTFILHLPSPYSSPIQITSLEQSVKAASYSSFTKPINQSDDSDSDASSSSSSRSPSPSPPPLKAPPPQQPLFLEKKTINIKLHDYTFFTNILFDQSLHRALMYGYFDKAWDCDEIDLLLRFLFVSSNDNHDVFKYPDSPINNEIKYQLTEFEENAANIRRRYMRDVLDGEHRSGQYVKKELDIMIQKLWPEDGERMEHTATITQGGICYQTRIDGITHVQDDIHFTLCDLLRHSLSPPPSPTLELNPSFTSSQIPSLKPLFTFTEIYVFPYPSLSLHYLSDSSHERSLNSMSPYFTSSSHPITSPFVPYLTSRVHLLPFPPRYLPSEWKDPVPHVIDGMFVSAPLIQRKWHAWILRLGGILYKMDEWLWQKFTNFVGGPDGNPYRGEEYMWEALTDMVKRSGGIESWEVIYEKKENGEFALVPPKQLTISSMTMSNPFKKTIDEERQLRLWKYMKTFREVVLTNHELEYNE